MRPASEQLFAYELLENDNKVADNTKKQDFLIHDRHPKLDKNKTILLL